MYMKLHVHVYMYVVCQKHYSYQHNKRKSQPTTCSITITLYVLAVIYTCEKPNHSTIYMSTFENITNMKTWHETKLRRWNEIKNISRSSRITMNWLI